MYYLKSRYYDPEISRWIHADSYISTGQGVLGNNMFAYCGNNPVNRVDYTGQFGSAIWGFVKTVVAETGKAMEVMSPAYAEYGGAITVDGPFLFGDVVGYVGAIALTAAALGYGIYQAIQDPAISTSKAKEKSNVVTTPNSSTPIYRYRGTDPGNLVPTKNDVSKGGGLSFSTIPKPGAAMTTIEAVNATGVLIAVQDRLTHVSVYPIGTTIEGWRNAGTRSIWTMTLKSIVVKWTP